MGGKDNKVKAPFLARNRKKITAHKIKHRIHCSAFKPRERWNDGNIELLPGSKVVDGDANKQTKTPLVTQYPITSTSTTTILPENVDQRFTQESHTKVTILPRIQDNQRHKSTPVLLSYHDITYK